MFLNLSTDFLTMLFVFDVFYLVSGEFKADYYICVFWKISNFSYLIDFLDLTQWESLESLSLLLFYKKE